MDIYVENPKTDNLYEHLTILCKTFKQVSKNPFDLSQQINFDLSDIKWVSPLLILPIASYICETNSLYITPTDQDANNYLQIIKFPNGINSIDQINTSKTYIPICVLEKNNPDKQKIEDSFAKMVYKVLNPKDDVKNAIYYPISEFIANIFDHSKVDKGYLFAQYYPKKDFVDLCIVDRGRGIAMSYKEEMNLDLTDEEALKYALQGTSTKPEYQRGYGIRTSKKIICQALKGEFILISGRAILYSSKGDKIFRFQNFYWKGVIVAYRIPRPKKPIDIYEYLEDY